jgi:hypothetical protein
MQKAVSVVIFTLHPSPVRVEQRREAARPSRHAGGALPYLDCGLRPPLDTNGIG